MTEERINEGKELLKTLSHLKDQKRRWESAKDFFRLNVKNDRGSILRIDSSLINFSELRLLTIANIDRRINAVQREFDEL